MFLKYREAYLNLIIVILIIKEKPSLEYNLFLKVMDLFIYYSILYGKYSREQILNQMNLKKNIRIEKLLKEKYPLIR
jgi:hypothetical protein